MQHPNVYHGNHGILCVFLTISDAREQIQSFVNGRQTPNYIPANHRVLKLKGTQDPLASEHLHLQMRSLQSLEKDHSRSSFQKGEGNQNLGSVPHGLFLSSYPPPVSNASAFTFMFGKNRVLYFPFSRQTTPLSTREPRAPLTLRGWAFSSGLSLWIFDMFRPKSLLSA